MNENLDNNIKITNQRKKLYRARDTLILLHQIQSILIENKTDLILCKSPNHFLDISTKAGQKFLSKYVGP